MSGTRGGRKIGWLPGRAVVSYQGGYLVELAVRDLGLPFSIRVWERGCLASKGWQWWGAVWWWPLNSPF